MNISHTTIGSGTATLLLHGFGFDSSIWKGLDWEAMSGGMWILPELPGFGDSDVPDTFELSWVGEQLFHWLQSQGIHSCHVVGHSMGGYIALEIARSHPEAVRSLTLLHSHCFPDDSDKQQDRFRKARFIQKHGTASFLSLFYPSVFKDQLIPPAFTPLLEYYLSSMQPFVLASYLEAMAARRDTRQVLTNLTVPVHLIHGRHDSLISEKSIFEMGLLPSRCTLDILESSGHMSMFEDSGLGALLMRLVGGV